MYSPRCPYARSRFQLGAGLGGMSQSEFLLLTTHPLSFGVLANINQRAVVLQSLLILAP